MQDGYSPERCIVVEEFFAGFFNETQ